MTQSYRDRSNLKVTMPRGNYCVAFLSSKDDGTLVSELKNHYEKVLHFRSQTQCLAFLKGAANGPHNTILLLDLDNVPMGSLGRSGSSSELAPISVIRVVNSDPSLCHVPCVAISFTADDDLICKALSYGAAGFHLRPLSAETISTLWVTLVKHQISRPSAPDQEVTSPRVRDINAQITPADRGVTRLMAYFCNPYVDVKLASFPSVDLNDKNIRQLISSWEFNALNLNDEQLYAVTLHIFDSLDLISHFQLPIDTLKRFILAIRANYRDNPYHNFFHAVDVLQSLYWLVINSSFHAHLKPVEVLALAVAALCHDVAHPGLNNFYQINARTPLALLYNNKSVLENLHSTVTFCVLARPELNFVASLAPSDIKEFRNLLITSILSTDMALHFDFVGSVRERLKKQSTSPFSYAVKEDLNLVTTGLIKSADLSNTARPFPISKKWAEVLLDEFQAQGQLEKKQGFPVMPYGAEGLQLWVTQKEFIEFVALPFYSELANLASVYSTPVENMKENLQAWKSYGSNSTSVNSISIPSNASEPKVVSPRSLITLAQKTSLADIAEKSGTESEGEESLTPKSTGTPVGTPTKDRVTLIKRRPRRNTHRRSCSDATNDMFSLPLTGANYQINMPRHSFSVLNSEDGGIHLYQPEPSAALVDDQERSSSASMASSISDAAGMGTLSRQNSFMRRRHSLPVVHPIPGT